MNVLLAGDAEVDEALEDILLFLAKSYLSLSFSEDGSCLE